MSVLSTIRAWTTEIGVYHTGSLYREENYPLYWLVRKVLSKVMVSDETVERLKALSEKGIIVFTLKNRSHRRENRTPPAERRSQGSQNLCQPSWR